MNKIVILGSTGSIGTQTLEVIDYLQEEWEVLALTANTNIRDLENQIKEYNPSFAVLRDKDSAKELRSRTSGKATQILAGVEGLEEVAGLEEADIVINALVGAVGLRPSVAAIKTGNRLGLANKESLVIGGSIIGQLRNEREWPILPIDSEHNAIFNILRKHGKNKVKNLMLTASGGPFLNKSMAELENVTVEEALQHPNWDMGKKITIDSATMMNKGLEIIEAHWLFNRPYDEIKVIVHPESIVHSLVEFTDNSIIAEMGVPDMRLPIQTILTYPEMRTSMVERLDLFSAGSLNFIRPDFKRFPALALAYEAGREGGSMPVVLNAANEVAVNYFLEKKISFTEIPAVIERVLTRHDKLNNLSLEDIFAVDKWSRRITGEVILCC